MLNQHSAKYLDWTIACYGHRHGKWVLPAPAIKPYHNRKSGKRWIKDEQRVIAQCGTYLRTLSRDEYPSYSEKAGMSPRALGCVNIMFKVGRETMEDGTRAFAVRFLNV